MGRTISYNAKIAKKSSPRKKGVIKFQKKGGDVTYTGIRSTRIRKKAFDKKSKTTNRDLKRTKIKKIM